MKSFSENQLVISNQNQEEDNYIMRPYYPRWDDTRNCQAIAKTHKEFTPTTCGSASFLEESEAEHVGLFQQGTDTNTCPYLGSFRSKFDNSSKPIFARNPLIVRRKVIEMLKGNGHLLTVAPTRAGKGSGQILMNLLTKAGSVVVLDIKGDNHAYSAGYRESEMGQKVYRFAPFAKSTSVWNPLAIKFAEPYQIEEYAVFLANLLITPDTSQNESFWNDAAKEFLVGLIVYVLTAPLTPKTSLYSDDQPVVHERSMRDLSRLTTLNAGGFTELLEEMMKSDCYIVRRYASSMHQKFMNEGRTGPNVLATLNRHLAVWHFERLHKATYRSSTDPHDKEPAPNDFDFSELLDGKTSIYLIIPPDALSEYRAVLRVMIGLAIRELTNSVEERLNNGVENNNPPVLFLLDEFPQLHYMSPIEDGLSYLAGYGINLWFFVQDINQLKIHYPHSWMSFFSNCAAKCFFGVNDLETATLVSEWIGNKTVEQYSRTESDSVNTHLYNSIPVKNRSLTSSYIARPVMTPDEVMRMSRYEIIIFMNGLHPIRGELPKYFEFEHLLKRSQILPLDEDQTALRYYLYLFLYLILFQYCLD